MFTGIISHRGTIVSRSSTTLTFSIPSIPSNPSNPSDNLKVESSIAVNGVCLTVVYLHANKIRVDIMPETWRKTALGKLRKGDLINLEFPMGINDLFEGHIVQGHVDGIAQVVTVKKEGNCKIITFKSDNNLTRYMVPKGSIAVDGISLTLISVKDGMFTVGIIPFTLAHTNMARVKVGSVSNIETDIIAKYVTKIYEGGNYARPQKR